MFDICIPLERNKLCKQKKINISLVDDCFLTRISIKRSFSSVKKFEILSDFSNAEDFIESIKNKTPDVVLLDLNLSGMNGLEATKFIKQNYPKIKIIILTSHMDRDFFAASMFFGANAFVCKDDDVSKLHKNVEAVYLGAYWFDPIVAKFYEKIYPKPDSFDLWNLYNKNDGLYPLTIRELEVLKLIVEGKTNSEIAKEIIVSTNTAKAHVGHILTKMNVTDRVQAAVLAVKNNLI